MAKEAVERGNAVETDCTIAAEFYADKPGAAGPETMIDLYRAIARLARIIEKLQDELDALRQPK